MNIQLGRLLVTAHRTRGPGWQVRRTGGRAVEAWVGRWMVGLWWRHRSGCGCPECEYERALMEVYRA